jgi:hypothetical protein
LAIIDRLLNLGASIITKGEMSSVTSHRRTLSLRSSTNSMSNGRTGHGARMSSLDNFVQSSSSSNVIFTPRSKEAMARLGLQPSELFIK